MAISQRFRILQSVISLGVLIFSIKYSSFALFDLSSFLGPFHTSHDPQPDSQPHIKTPPTMSPRAPVLALTHGGGPLPLYAASEAALAASLRTKAPAVLGLDGPAPPRALLVVTAHWQTAPELRVSAASRHELLFDYNNFPPETYKYTYDAPGDPEVAGWVAAALRGEGWAVVEDVERGKLPSPSP